MIIIHTFTDTDAPDVEIQVVEYPNDSRGRYRVVAVGASVGIIPFYSSEAAAVEMAKSIAGIE